ncbi:MAG TPA: hypothetical protein VJ142_02975 [Candidatus Nanoarchaeia archaeon]|nr:hypothetical protein [Candidatus Nanoarchaeia archaeon]
MAEKLENKLKGICPSCKKESAFNYHGEQEMINRPPIQLYDCNSCGSSIELNRIYDRNPELRASSQ